MFLIDDLLLRLFGISLKPFDMIWLLELTRNYALKEKYDLKKINDQIKENRLFFEINEINEAEYEKNNELLLKEREVAEHVMANLSNDMRIQEL